MTPVLGIEAASALLPNEAWAIPASPEPEVKLLVVFVIKTAREEGKDYMWLGVYEKNVPAQHFYKRHGFSKVSQHTFQVGSDPQTDWLLVKKLTRN